MPVFAVSDLALTEPSLGEATLHHDPTFAAWDDTFDTVRDAVNLGIRQLNHVGAGLPTLPEESLEELLVQPLSGDYSRIRQNADAARVLAHAFGEWSRNVAGLGLRVAPVWEGEAATACVGQLGGYAMGAFAADLTIGQAATVFDLLAHFSERIAITVERALVRLGQVLQRLAVRIVEKLAGVAGVAKLVVDFISDGLGVVTDIINDIELVISLIAEIRGLFDEVRTYVSDVERQLQPLLGLPDLLRASR